jgi:Lon protease-like protein
VEEDFGRAYRLASVEPIAERALEAEDRGVVRRQRSKLEVLLASTIERNLGKAHVGPRESRGGDAMIPSEMGDEDLVNALAQYLDLEPIEKQALLEKRCLRSRAESLVELLEMKIMTARVPGGPSHFSH